MRSFFKSRIAIALHFCFVLMASAQFRQQGPKLVGSGGSGPLVYQGDSVALSADGNTAIIGGFGDYIAGAVWVFTRTDGAWTQQGSKLVGSGAIGSVGQGQSVALSADGNTALVGGSADNSYAGAVWVFTRFGGVWSQQGGKLVGSGAIPPASRVFLWPCRPMGIPHSWAGPLTIVPRLTQWVPPWVFTRSAVSGANKAANWSPRRRAHMPDQVPPWRCRGMGIPRSWAGLMTTSANGRVHGRRLGVHALRRRVESARRQIGGLGHDWPWSLSRVGPWPCRVMGIPHSWAGLLTILFPALAQWVLPGCSRAPAACGVNRAANWWARADRARRRAR